MISSMYQVLGIVSVMYLTASTALVLFLLVFIPRKDYKLSKEEASDLFIDWGLRGLLITWIITMIFYMLGYQGSNFWFSHPILIIAGSVILYVSTEVFLYLLHFLCHKVSCLWVFHKKHHSIKVFSFTNSIVDSFVFQLTTILLFLLTTVLFHVPILCLVIAYSFWRVVLSLAHMGNPISYGVIGYIFLDSETHQKHHDKCNQDYAVTFRALDYLFKFFYEK